MIAKAIRKCFRKKASAKADTVISTTQVEKTPTFDCGSCSICAEPLGVIRVLKDWGVDTPWPDRYEVLVKCMIESCSWSNCKIHLSLNAVGYIPLTERVSPPKAETSRAAGRVRSVDCGLLHDQPKNRGAQVGLPASPTPSHDELKDMVREALEMV
tara:strand:+ start:956 stop:1423 length:468 start_codon:yes stop_codon:yes gene_type:complete